MCTAIVPPPGASFSGTSAEWIMEANTLDSHGPGLPAFSPVHFSLAFCCDATGQIGNPQNGEIVNIAPMGNPTATLTATTAGPYSVTIVFGASP
jgi:hypothetical protein